MENKDIILYACPGLRAKITLEQCKTNFEKGGNKACSICPEPLFQKNQVKGAIVVTKDRSVDAMSKVSGYDKSLIVNLGWLLAANKIPAKNQTLEAVYRELLKHGFTRDEIARCKHEGPKTFVTKVGEVMGKRLNTRQELAKFLGFENNTLKKVHDRLIETNMEKGPQQGTSGEAYVKILKHFTPEEFIEAWEKCKKNGEGYELRDKPVIKEVVRQAKTLKPVAFINPEEKSIVIPQMAKASLQVAEPEKASGILNMVQKAYADVKEANTLPILVEKLAMLLPVGTSITIMGKFDNALDKEAQGHLLY